MYGAIASRAADVSALAGLEAEAGGGRGARAPHATGSDGSSDGDGGSDGSSDGGSGGGGSGDGGGGVGGGVGGGGGGGGDGGSDDGSCGGADGDDGGVPKANGLKVGGERGADWISAAAVRAADGFDAELLLAAALRVPNGGRGRVRRRGSPRQCWD